jgi:hypothetical protein
MMKRPRPTAKHSYRDIYAQALSHAFFIRNKEDEDRVYKALLRRNFQTSEIRRLLLKVYFLSGVLKDFTDSLS